MTRAMLSSLAAAALAMALAAAMAAPPPPRHTVATPRAATRAARPATVRSGGVVLVAAGDIACRPGLPPTPAGCQQQATARAVLAQHPRAVLLLGDNQYRDGALWKYRASYQPSWGRFIKRTYPTPGNHEYRTRGAAGYFRYFGSRAAAPVRPWYSFRLGSWHLVALNSNCGAVDCTAEAAWLRADLATHPARCTLAYWHHPRFSSGHEGGTRAVGPCGTRSTAPGPSWSSTAMTTTTSGSASRTRLAGPTRSTACASSWSAPAARHGSRSGRSQPTAGSE